MNKERLQNMGIKEEKSERIKKLIEKGAQGSEDMRSFYADVFENVLGKDEYNRLINQTKEQTSEKEQKKLDELFSEKFYEMAQKTEMVDKLEKYRKKILEKISLLREELKSALPLKKEDITDEIESLENMVKKITIIEKHFKDTIAKEEEKIGVLTEESLEAREKSGPFKG